MDVKKLLDARWSCRAFLPDQVPDDDLRAMFEIAQRTASWCNTQPWQVVVTRGEATRRFGRSLTEHARTHDPNPDLPMPAGYSGVYRDRRREAGFALYASLGIGREDKDRREVQRLRNFDFFDAPHVAVITTDREQGTYGAIDCGGYVANLVHAATSMGIASIPQAAIALHSDHVLSYLRLPEDRLVVCGVSFGYADTDHPVNGFRTTRADADGAVTFLD
ncbi:nitroreductase [Pseudonocardia sp. C8]|uniref:nitroreductase n=1 Tax=Pseudonocardia sp. C8 TaxID=2762759 RepID=UPI00164256DD|nr:nitroreductase [Pseudonocardia sp. C8]MBC3191737.1 nitroreductase [Pseudonocardia sp. C8]